MGADALAALTGVIGGPGTLATGMVGGNAANRLLDSDVARCLVLGRTGGYGGGMAALEMLARPAPTLLTSDP